MAIQFRIEGWVFLLWALGILLLPLAWMAAVLLAMTIHELFHLLAAKLIRVPVYAIHVGIRGCRIMTAPMDRREEILTAAAGPFGSFCLLLFMRHYPSLAFCGLVQGLWNLIPQYSSDGGRILRCLAGERICVIAENVSEIMILVFGIWAAVALECLPIFLFIIWNCLPKIQLSEKFLAKKQK